MDEETKTPPAREPAAMTDFEVTRLQNDLAPPQAPGSDRRRPATRAWIWIAAALAAALIAAAPYLRR